MEHYAGIDVSLELSSVCVVDTQGKIVKETKVASEPEALIDFFGSQDFTVKRIGLEAEPLSQWLHAGLKREGFETVLLEMRQCEGGVIGDDSEDGSQGCARACSADPDGFGLRPAHAKSMGSQEVRALLVARKQLLGRLIDGGI